MATWSESDNPRIVVVGDKNIIRVEYPDGISQENVLLNIDKVNEFIRACDPQSALVLSIFGDYKQVVTNEIVDKFRDALKENAPFVKKSAVVGISGIRKIFFNSLMVMTRRVLRLFESETEALNYLAE